ncbi:MAG: hypothetical protein ACTSQJ_12275 [Promethearchaeota archaeon]
MVGNSCQILRIENRELSAFITTGINPISKRNSPLDLEINGKRFTTNNPVDLAYISIGIDDFLICTSLKKLKNTRLTFPTGASLKLKYGIN